MKVISSIVKTFGLSAVFSIAWTQHLGVLADENPAGGGFGRSGAEDRLAAAGNGSVNSGLFKVEDGGHGGATRGPGQFDGQAVHSDGGWRDVAFGSVGTNGVVAGISTDAQATGLTGEGKDDEGGGAVRGRGRVPNGGNGFGGGDNGGVMDVMIPPRVEGGGAVGRTGGGTVDAEPRVTLARRDQYRALDFPDMDDSPPRVVLGIKKNKSRTASALTAPLSGQGQQYIPTTSAHGRQLQETWNKRGGDIEGEDALDRFGYSTAISGNGLVLAVGATWTDGVGTNSGSVSVYDWDGSNHVQRGSNLGGEAAGDRFGWSVAISDDGSILAAGALFNDGNGTNRGSASVYYWDGTNYVQRGGDIDGEAAFDRFGSSVSLSGDGSVLAVGAPLNNGNGTDSGSVRVYGWDGSNYDQRGGDIEGEAAGDEFGTSVSISNDGSVLAVGAPHNAGNGTDSGSARAYYWDGSTYVQRGGDIDGESVESGFSVEIHVAISDDGSILAVGTGSFSGSVRVYYWDGSNYVQRGGDIDGEGEAGDQFGRPVAISGDGSVLAVGTRDTNNGDTYFGSVRVYDWDGSNYVQRGFDIDGEGLGDRFGWSVAISDDGLALAVGAHETDGIGTNSGSAHVYTWSVLTSPPTNQPSTLPTLSPTSSPTPCVGGVLFVVDLKTDDYPDETSWTLTNMCTNTSEKTENYIGFAIGTLFSSASCVPAAKYNFTIEDTFGDGVCCDVGIGGYNVTYDGIEVASGGDFGSFETVEFGDCEEEEVMSDGPWDINFLDLSANFSVNSNEELVFNYEIGKDRQFDTFLFMKDCTTNVTDISINHTEPLLTSTTASTQPVTTTTPTASTTPFGGFPRRRALNDNFSTLTLGYDIDKSMIANSSIWNATSSQIELCQVVQLLEGTLVIAEDKRQVAIDFDLRVDYEVNDIELGAETINAGNDTVDASSYIEACKCDGVSFVCNTDDLVPNSPLIVCIKSVSSDLVIDFLDSMNVTQGDQDMAVITNQAIMFSSFTSVEYVSDENGVVVSTRVPANVFDYNTVGSVIGINGGLVMKLAGIGRNLKTDIGAKLDTSEEASFEIEVTLQRELGLVGETSLNSAANVASSKGVIGPIMLLAWANVMW